jgi:hypothetical protein
MAQRTEPTAAQALYGHLPSAARPEVKQKERTLAEALYPRPSRDQQLWDEICKRQRDNFLRGWREQRGERGG